MCHVLCTPSLVVDINVAKGDNQPHPHDDKPLTKGWEDNSSCTILMWPSSILFVKFAFNQQSVCWKNHFEWSSYFNRFHQTKSPWLNPWPCLPGVPPHQIYFSFTQMTVFVCVVTSVCNVWKERAVLVGDARKSWWRLLGEKKEGR